MQKCEMNYVILILNVKVRVITIMNMNDKLRLVDYCLMAVVASEQVDLFVRVLWLVLIGVVCTKWWFVILCAFVSFLFIFSISSKIGNFGESVKHQWIDKIWKWKRRINVKYTTKVHNELIFWWNIWSNLLLVTCCFDLLIRMFRIR